MRAEVGEGFPGVFPKAFSEPGEQQDPEDSCRERIKRTGELVQGPAERYAEHDCKDVHMPTLNQVGHSCQRRK